MKMRNLWEKYYDSAHCILYVVDSADSSRLDEAKLAFGMVYGIWCMVYGLTFTVWFWCLSYCL
ncbi:hypothetical protein EON63_06345 [archaeon]|nr:MAG: hypothetical protein EON63_06345 [archaeon]